MYQLEHDDDADTVDAGMCAYMGLFDNACARACACSRRAGVGLLEQSGLLTIGAHVCKGFA